MKFFATILISTAAAWWDNGHLIVSRIAYDILQQKSPEALDKVNSILSVLKKSDPSYTDHEGKYPFVECSTFADKIKYKGGSYQSPWHFIDQAYLDQGGTIKDFPDFQPDVHNVTEALASIRMWMTAEEGYKNTYVYDQIMSHGLSGHTEADGLSTATRFLIHYTGDIH